MFDQSLGSQNAVAVVKPRLKEVQDLYIAAVRDCLGCFSKIDKDGDIVFKYGGLSNLIFSIDADDLGYFRLLEQVIVGDANDENEIKVLEAVNNVAITKCAKLSIRKQEGKLILVNTAEAFLAASGETPSKDIIYATLERYANILVVARQSFTAELEIII